MLRSLSSRGLRPLRNVPFRYPKPEIPLIPEFFPIILTLFPVPTAAYYSQNYSLALVLLNLALLKVSCGSAATPTLSVPGQSIDCVYNAQDSWLPSDKYS